MVWRLDKHVTRVGKRQETTRVQAFDEIRHDMNVGAGDQPERNALAIELFLQRLNLKADLRPGILIHPWQNVRRARDDRDTVIDEGARHGARHRRVRRAVVNAG